MEEQEKNLSEMWAALRGAQLSLNAVVKDAQNDWGKYGYTSAEEMIGQCRRALLDNRLVFTRKRWGLQDSKVTSEFVLAHPDSGGAMEFSNEMIVVAGKNPDKTVLAALTTVMNYTLRDLLMVPRLDSQPEIDSMPQAERAAPAPKPKPSASLMKSVAKPKLPEAAPDWMVKAFDWVLADKPDPKEYKTRLLSAAEGKYGCEFTSIESLPEEYLMKVFEHHGYTVSLKESKVNKESK